MASTQIGIKTNDTIMAVETFVLDPELIVTLEPNTKYELMSHLITNHGYQFAASLPSQLVFAGTIENLKMMCHFRWINTPTARYTTPLRLHSNNFYIDSGDNNLGGGFNAAYRGLWAEYGIIDVGATGGTLQMQYRKSSNTPGQGGNVGIYAGSFLFARRLCQL